MILMLDPKEIAFGKSHCSLRKLKHDMDRLNSSEGIFVPINTQQKHKYAFINLLQLEIIQVFQHIQFFTTLFHYSIF